MPNYSSLKPGDLVYVGSPGMGGIPVYWATSSTPGAIAVRETDSSDVGAKRVYPASPGSGAIPIYQSLFFTKKSPWGRVAMANKQYPELDVASQDWTTSNLYWLL